MTVGERIKNRRLELGMSLEDLAQKLGKNKSTIFRYENGDITKMPISFMRPLAQALNTTPEFLMGWDDEEIKKVSQQVIAFTQYEEDKKSIAAEIVESNTLSDIKRLQKCYSAMHDLTDDEMNQVVEYAMFLKQRRKE